MSQSEATPEGKVKQEVAKLEKRASELESQLATTSDPQTRKLVIDTIVEVRSTVDDLLKSLVSSVKNVKNQIAYNEALTEHHLDFQRQVNRAVIDYTQNEETAKEFMAKTKSGDRLRAVPRIIAVLLVGIVIVMALVEMEKPTVYLPLEAWLWPSTSNCLIEAKQNVSGNATAVTQYANHCVSQLNLIGYEHIGMVVALITFITVVGIFAWKRVKPK